MSEGAHMTEERQMMLESARDFVAKEILPVANELDPIQGDIPMDLRRKMGEMGYFGIQLPEGHGGLGPVKQILIPSNDREIARLMAKE